MNRIFFLSLFLLSLTVYSCESLVGEVNENPNQIAANTLEAQQYLKGAQLANIGVQTGHLQRVAAMWSGQLTGMSGMHQELYQYQFSETQSDASWINAYHGVLTQLRHIRETLPDRPLYQGIAKVLEAQVVGTLASIYGDIPYSEIQQTDENGAGFDEQQAVFRALQALLDAAIADLTTAPEALISSDLYYAGDKEKWTAAAWTLKARFFLLTRDYDKAYTAALNGIDSPEGSMKFYPVAGDGTQDKNLFYSLISGTYAGEIGSDDSYLMDLLNAGNPLSRNHSKTREAARRSYLYIQAADASANLGVAAAAEPMPLILYEENLLILAEAGARTISLPQGLQYLNQLRGWLRSGAAFTRLDPGEDLKYDPFIPEDFSTGGIENLDAIDMDRALLREIMEERYVSGFGQFMPFDDARRLRKEDADIAVPIPLNTTSATQHPERFMWSAVELNTNSHAPGPDPGIYEKTAVNR